MSDPGSMSVLSLVATATVVIVLGASILSFEGMITQAEHKNLEQWVIDELRPRVQSVCTSSQGPLPPDRNLTRGIEGDNLKIETSGASNNHRDTTYEFVLVIDGESAINVDLADENDCSGVSIDNVATEGQAKLRVDGTASGGAHIEVN